MPPSNQARNESEAAFHKLIKLGPRHGTRALIGKRECKVLATVLREDQPTAAGLLVLYRFSDTDEERLVPLRKWPNTKPPREDQTNLWSHRPEAGTSWRHFKGGLYGVMTNACLDTTGEHFVVYQSEENALRWARHIVSWLENTPEGKPRFARVR